MDHLCTLQEHIYWWQFSQLHLRLKLQHRRRLWGKKDSTVYAANVENFLTTQKTTAAGMMLVCAVLFLPALALRPVLALPLDALQPVTERARVAALGAAIEWLPKISGGALNFHVSAAAGQTAQDDTFYYFPRGEAKTLLTARADADPSVLDRLESAYAAYAESRYLATPDGADYGTLQEFCNAAEKEHKLTGDADAIRTFVRSYLNEHCTYTSDPPQPADGADPVLYFLNESHAGSSTQFASAAAVLAALAVWGIARARRTPADTVRAEFRALYKKMCRCGLSEGVSSDQEEFKQFLREHTKTAAPQDVETLLALVQTAQFAPGPVSAQTAQQVRGLCRILRKNLHR